MFFNIFNRKFRIIEFVNAGPRFVVQQNFKREYGWDFEWKWETLDEFCTLNDAKIFIKQAKQKEKTLKYYGKTRVIGYY